MASYIRAVLGIVERGSKATNMEPRKIEARTFIPTVHFLVEF